MTVESSSGSWFVRVAAGCCGVLTIIVSGFFFVAGAVCGVGDGTKDCTGPHTFMVVVVALGVCGIGGIVAAGARSSAALLAATMVAWITAILVAVIVSGVFA